MIGALLHYLANAEPNGFAPVNAMIGLLPELPENALDAKAIKKSGGPKSLKAAKREALRETALAALKQCLPQQRLPPHLQL
jgi:folate-dependent tRNA-U54 methylase TrmFO/GidA